MKRMPLALTVVCSTALAACTFVYGQTKRIEPGDDPPALVLANILQAPTATEATWQTLKGKVVVLEFWATWCAPCIAAIPHLNELADQFKDKPVQFIAITDEDQQIIAAFLGKKPIHAWIGLNPDQSVFRNYGVTGIPHTVIVDQHGKIAAVTNPAELTAQGLTDLLAGKKLALNPPRPGGGVSFRPGELPSRLNGGPEAMFQVLLRQSATTNGGAGWSAGNFTLIGSKLTTILAACYNINSVRILTNCALPEATFDAVVKTPVKQDEVGRNWLRQAVETTFGIVARRESREMPVLVLTAKHPAAEHLRPTVSTGGSSSRSVAGSMQGINLSLAAFAGNLEGLLQKPVLDETGLAGHYDFELKWDATDPGHTDVQVLAKAIREQLGLDLTPARRAVDVLVVENRK